MTRLSCSDLRTLFEETPTAVVLVDGDGRIRVLNGKAAELFGYTVEELEGERVEVLVPGGLEEEHRSQRERYMEDPEPRPMGVGLELEAERRDGSTFPVEISLSPVELDGGLRIMAAVRDVSERRELRTWGTEAVEAAEEERLRIAQELHDDLAQRLAALQMQARLLGRAEGELADELLRELQEEVRASSRHVRRIIRGLRPPTLSELGLGTALRHEVQRQLEDASVERNLEIAPVDGPLEDRVQLALYRVTQEAVRNAVQHADASRISVRLRKLEDGQVELAVEDDGRGFDADRVAVSEDRYGLIGMRERVSAVGGRIDLESAPGEGTSIRVRVPGGSPGPS